MTHGTAQRTDIDFDNLEMVVVDYQYNVVWNGTARYRNGEMIYVIPPGERPPDFARAIEITL